MVGYLQKSEHGALRPQVHQWALFFFLLSFSNFLFYFSSYSNSLNGWRYIQLILLLFISRFLSPCIYLKNNRLAVAKIIERTVLLQKLNYIHLVCGKKVKYKKNNFVHWQQKQLSTSWILKLLRIQNIRGYIDKDNLTLI